MKKILYTTGLAVLMVSVLVFFNQSYAAIVTVDSYALNDTNFINLFEKSRWGQSFTNTDSITLDSVAFIVNRSNNSPTGNVYAKIYAHTGTYGTDSNVGTLLATSDAVDVSLLATSSLSAYTFDFSGAERITLSASTYYVATLEYLGTDPSKYINTVAKCTSPTHSGNSVSYSVSSWSSFAVCDLDFYVYGDDAPATTVTVNPYDTLLFE